MEMPQVQRGEGTGTGECRQCRTFCDRLVEPRGCLESRCGYLYSYFDENTGARYMGCIRKVFKAEIDIDLFEAAERSGGYGGIKMTGEPIAQCQVRVEPCYEGAGPAYECVNPDFFDAQQPEFDLRDVIA